MWWQGETTSWVLMGLLTAQVGKWVFSGISRREEKRQEQRRARMLKELGPQPPLEEFDRWVRDNKPKRGWNPYPLAILFVLLTPLWVILGFRLLIPLVVDALTKARP